jgi:hypothetical protein
VSPAASQASSAMPSPAAWMQQQRIARSFKGASSTTASNAPGPLSSSLTQISNDMAFADLSPFTSQPPPPKKTLSQQQQEKSMASVASSSNSLSSVFSPASYSNAIGAEHSPKCSGALGSEDFPVSITSMNSNEVLKGPGLISRSSTQEGQTSTSKPMSQPSLSAVPSLSLQQQQQQGGTQVEQPASWAQAGRPAASAFEFQAAAVASVMAGSAWRGTSASSLATSYQDPASASAVSAVSSWTAAQPHNNHSGVVYQQHQGASAADNFKAAPAVRASPFAQGMPYMTPMQQLPGHHGMHRELKEDGELEPVLSRMPSLHLGAHNDWWDTHADPHLISELHALTLSLPHNKDWGDACILSGCS